MAVLLLLLCGALASALAFDCSRVAPNQATTLRVADIVDSQTHSVLVEGCTWTNARVTLQFPSDYGVAVTLRGVTVLSGSVVFECAACGGGLIVVNDSRAVGCSDCFSVRSPSSLTSVSLSVSNCDVTGTVSAASLIAVQVRNSSINVFNSTFSVESGSSSVHAVSLAPVGSSAIQATNVSVTVRSSQVRTKSTVATASAAAILADANPSASVSLDNVLFWAVSSVVSAKAGGSAASLGAVARTVDTICTTASTTLLLTRLTIRADNSQIESAGFDSVAAMGAVGRVDCSKQILSVLFSVQSQCTLQVSRLTIVAMNSTASSVSSSGSAASAAVSALGRAKCVNGNSMIGCKSSSTTSLVVDAMDVSVVDNSFIIAQGGEDSTTAVGSAASGMKLVHSISRTTLLARSSAVRAVGHGYCAALGHTAYQSDATSTLVLSLSDVKHLSDASQLSAVGAAVIAVQGIAVSAQAPLNLFIVNNTLQSSLSFVYVTGSTLIAALGIAMQSPQATGDVRRSSLTVSGSTFVVSASDCVGVAGISLCSNDVVIANIVDVEIQLKPSSNISVHGDRGVGTAGIAVFATSSAALSAVGLQLVASESTVSSSAACGTAVVGVASCTYGSTVLSLDSTTITAANSALYAQGTSSVACVGMTARSMLEPSYSASAKIAASSIRIDVSNSNVTADGGAAGNGVAAAGIATFSLASYNIDHSPFTVDVVADCSLINGTVSIDNSKVAAVGAKGVVSCGSTVFCSSQCRNGRAACYPIANANHSVVATHFSVTRSRAEATGLSTVAANGIATTGNDVVVQVSNTAINTRDATTDALASQACAASSGLASSSQKLSIILHVLAIDVSFSVVHAGWLAAVSVAGVAATTVQSSTWDLSDISIAAESCVAVASGAASVASVAISCFSTGVDMIGDHIDIHASNSTVSAGGSSSIAAMGVAVSGTAISETLRSLSICLSSSSVTAAAQTDVAVASGAGVVGNTASILFERWSLVAFDSNVSASGVSGTAAHGVAASTQQISTVSIADTVIVASRATIQSVGGSAAGSGAIAATSATSCSVTCTNLTVQTTESSLTAVGNYAVASVGAAVFSTYSASSGFSIYSAAAIVALRDVTLHVNESIITSRVNTADGHAIASQGFAAYSFASRHPATSVYFTVATTSHMTLGNVILVQVHSTVSATGAQSVACFGASANAISECTNGNAAIGCCKSSQSSTDVDTITLQTYRSASRAYASGLASCGGFLALLRASRGVVARVVESEFYCDAPGCAGLLSSASAQHPSVSFVVVRTKVTVNKGGACLNFVPSDANVQSVIRHSDISCSQVGWSSFGASALNCCGENVTLDGVATQPNTINGRFPGLAYSSGSCPATSEESFAPTAAVFVPLCRALAKQPEGHPTPTINRTLTRSKRYSPTTSLPTHNSATNAHSTSSSSVAGQTTPTREGNTTASLTSSASLPVVQGAQRHGPEAVLQEIVTEEAARSIIASASGGAFVGGVMGAPMSAAVAVRIGLVASVLHCEFAEDAVEPSSVDYPSHIRVFGDGVGAHASGIASTCLLLLTLILLSIAVPRFVALTRTFEAMLVQYFFPSVVRGTMIVLRHSSDAAVIATALLCVVPVAAVTIHRAFVVLYVVPRETTSERMPRGLRGTIKLAWEGLLVKAYGPYFDFCRDGARVLIRAVFFVEVGASTVIAAIVGWTPTASSCDAEAALCLAVVVVLLVYLAALRPYERRREMALSLGFAVVQSMQALCVVLALRGWSHAAPALAVLSLIQYSAIMLQCAVHVAWQFVLIARRNTLQRHTGDESASCTANQQALLVPVTACSQNPLGTT